MIETVVSPFHCLYQDALYFHTESKLALGRSESEASRLARRRCCSISPRLRRWSTSRRRSSGQPELAGLLADPRRPIPLQDVWRLLPAAIMVRAVIHSAAVFDPESPPWPQFAELLDTAGVVGVPRSALGTRGRITDRPPRRLL